MIFSEAKQGRTFIIRLEDGEIVHETLEKFAVDHRIKAATVIILGGADKGSRLVVGPQQGRANPIMPMQHELYEAHEVTGTGTIFPDEGGNPILHLHIACGREENTVTGCIREGIKVWHVMEVVMFEITSTTATRKPDPEIGFKLLIP